MSNTFDWRNCRNILCVRLDNLGDVLMTTPALRALKESASRPALTLLTSSAGSAISRLIPEIDATIIFDVPWVKNNTPRADVLDVVKALAAQKFDAAVIFTTYSQNPLPAAMLCYLAGIPNVLGYCRENPYQLINCWVPDSEPLDLIQHEVERQLALVKVVGAITKNTRLDLRFSSASKTSATNKLASYIDMGKPWLLLHSGVSEEKRRYPLSQYAVAMRELAKQGYQIVLTGSSSEQEYVGTLADAIGTSAHNTAGVFSLEELAAVIKQAPVLVSNNTGPVHIAASVGTPVVVLYALTNPQHTPWRTPAEVLYFSVAPEQRSKNRFLQHFPGPSMPQASPEAIVKAVENLTKGSMRA
jgi:lipopolysaccharide heptosyltransferase II